MSGLLLLFLSVLVNVTASSDAAMGCRVDTSKEYRPAVTELKSANPVASASKTDVRTLAQGKYSRVETPFIMVSRSPDTYNQMRTLLGSLPDLDTDFFTRNVVVAAFLGQRSTGGYGVEIVFDNKVRVIETTAAAAGNVTQQITNPFTVIAIPIGRETPLFIEPDRTWMKAMTPYQVTEARYTATFDDSSRSKKVNLTGRIDALRYESIVTLFFHTISQEKLVNGLLIDVLTVQVAHDGSFSTGLPATDSLGSQQHIVGKFWDSNRRLSIEISPLKPGASSNSGRRYFIEACTQQASQRKR